MSERKPWLCPRCKQVNAPWVDHCNCKSDEVKITINPSQTNGYECPNCGQWYQVGYMHFCYSNNLYGNIVCSQDSCAGTKLKF